MLLHRLYTACTAANWTLDAHKYETDNKQFFGHFSTTISPRQGVKRPDIGSTDNCHPAVSVFHSIPWHFYKQPSPIFS